MNLIPRLFGYCKGIGNGGAYKIYVLHVSLHVIHVS